MIDAAHQHVIKYHRKGKKRRERGIKYRLTFQSI